MPLCANNKVSRGGLHTQPTRPTSPVFERLSPLPPAQAQAIVQEAGERVDQVRRSVDTAPRGQLNDLLSTAQKEVEKARRTPGARRELRQLETKLEQLRREVKKREEAFEYVEHSDRAKRERMASAFVDRLAPSSLGMGPRGARTLPPPSTPRVSGQDTSPTVTTPAKSTQPPTAPSNAQITAAQREFKSAARDVTRAASEAELDRIQAKIDASLPTASQKADSRQKQSLRDRHRNIQRQIEAKRAEFRPAAEIRMQAELTRLLELKDQHGSKALSNQVGDFSEAAAAGFMQLVFDAGLLDQHNIGDKRQGLDIVALVPSGFETIEVKGTLQMDAPRPATKDTKGAGHQGSVAWVTKNSANSSVAVSAEAVGDAPDQMRSRVCYVDLVGGTISLWSVDSMGTIAKDADVMASLNDVLQAIDGS